MINVHTDGYCLMSRFAYDLEQLKAPEDALRMSELACDQVFCHLSYRETELRQLYYCGDNE
jgi:hypothetical protein